MLKDFNIPTESWEQTAQDRAKWRGLIRRGASEYETKRISEAEQKRAQRKARAKASLTELSVDVIMLMRNLTRALKHYMYAMILFVDSEDCVDALDQLGIRCPHMPKDMFFAGHSPANIIQLFRPSAIMHQVIHSTEGQ